MVFERVSLGAAGIVFKQRGRRGLPNPGDELAGSRTLIRDQCRRTGMNIAWQMMPVMGHSSPWAALIGGLFCVF
jgi:hypothetical protein